MSTPATPGWWFAGVGGLLCLWGCAHQPIRPHTESSRAALSLYMRGLMFERTSKLDEAVDAYRQALEHDYQAPSLHVRLGATHVKLGQPEQALKYFNRALAIDPDHRDALRWVAMLQTSQGRIAEAIHAYARLLEQDPTDRFILSTLADLYVLDGQIEPAIALYQRLVLEYGSAHQLHFNLGVLYGRLGDFSWAVAELSRALELMPDSIETRLALGLTYELNQQPEEALAHYEDAARLDPLNPRLYLHAARAAMSRQRFEDAVRYYQTALDLDPGELETIVGLVRLWMLRHEFEQAHRLLGRKLATLSRATELYLLLGMLYQEVGAPLEALRAFERAASVSRETSAQAQFYLGAQLERLGRKTDARGRLRKAIAMDPHYADALNYLGYLDAEDGVNLHEAKAMIERAVALDPANGAYLDSLGWVHFKLGDAREAVTYLERAAQALATDPAIFDHLGDVYFTQGDVARAQGAWRKALELDESLQDITRKLESSMSREAAAGTAP